MAYHPLAPGRPGRFWRRAWQLPGDRAAGCQSEAAQLYVAADGRPHLCGSRAIPLFHHVPVSYSLPRLFVNCMICDVNGGMQDNPVGAGYSYVEDPSALAKTDLQATTDVVELLKALTKEISTLRCSPLFFVGESYGGKHAAMIGASVARAIHAGSLNLTLGGVALGDSWISPDDFALSYAQLLHDVSRLNDNAVGDANKMAVMVKEQVLAGQFAAARKTWTDLLDLIDSRSDSVNMENFLLDAGMNPVLADDLQATSSSLRSTQLMYLSSQASVSAPNTIYSIMNGVIKKKLKIIPKDLIWQEASIDVYNALANDFMKPTINEVDELLSYGVNVTVYNGQLDVICSTIGAEEWVNKLKWDGLKNFLSQPRQPLHYCGSAIYCSKPIKAYVRSYKNMQFYWVLEAGHMVPVDQPYVAFRLIASLTQSPGSD
ncbi:serine carboxypeptidase-like 51 [Phragmites australis]|uniref:serine carboxypeptidase-like 51 n=1 Tax=Phragmites australis TaxID=29695 RepID=UPI002D76E955|nr:serine carboxypeptidase-like 51 [Phragmites australis]